MQLAIETTGRTGSLAVLLGESCLWQSNLDPATRTAASIAPEIDRALKWCRDEKHDLGFVSVADGPGSFTGLRIAVTTAKTLSYALGLPLVAVDSLASIAAAAFHDHPNVDALLIGVNAYRGQVFRSTFRRELLLPTVGQASDQAIPDGWSGHPAGVSIVECEQWKDQLAKSAKDDSIAGDQSCFGELAPQRLSRQCDAIGVGLLGWRAAICSDWADPIGLAPRYLKPSAAEEKAAAR